MPVSLFTFGIEPEDPNAPISRFLEFWKFDRPIYPTDNPTGIRRPVDVQNVLTKVIVSPFAELSTKTNVDARLIPTAEELQRYG